jgi:hypothetical protein
MPRPVFRPSNVTARACSGFNPAVETSSMLILLVVFFVSLAFVSFDEEASLLEAKVSVA